MNGKAAKRIRLASEGSGVPVKQLKREYKALPYHRRKLWTGAGIEIASHKRAIAQNRYILGRQL